MVEKPLQRDLADGLQIKTAKYKINEIDPNTGKLRRYTEFSKEITIGLLEGDYTNKLNVIHLDKIIDVFGDQ